MNDLCSIGLHGHRPETGKKPDAAELEKACTEMESFFIHNLLKAMRATVPESGLFGGKNVMDRYSSMLDGYLARELASKGGIGLAREISGQFSAADELYAERLKSGAETADKSTRQDKAADVK